MARVIAEFEKVVVYANPKDVELAQSMCGSSVSVVPGAVDDGWSRDTGPMLLTHADARVRAACFQFNGWGGKYVLSGDDGVASFVAAKAGVPVTTNDWVFEGGSVDVDGIGTALTTRQCLLNSNRNPNMTHTDIERCLRADLGIETIIWLGDGLANDHTDGHVDNVARFAAPGVVVCMEPGGSDDPNRDILKSVIDELKRAKDVTGQKIEIVTVPSPGRVEDAEGELIPASFMNFYIGNTTVVVPVYGTKSDDVAVDRIAKLFPTRRTVGLPANHVITGGGSFHCITQQQPAV